MTKRQENVLWGLVNGKAEKEVARDLGLSMHTVHTHVKALHREFDVCSRGELLALFIDRDLVTTTIEDKKRAG